MKTLKNRLYFHMSRSNIREKNKKNLKKDSEGDKQRLREIDSVILMSS